MQNVPSSALGEMERQAAGGLQPGRGVGQVPLLEPGVWGLTGVPGTPTVYVEACECTWVPEVGCWAQE